MPDTCRPPIWFLGFLHYFGWFAQEQPQQKCDSLKLAVPGDDMSGSGQELDRQPVGVVTAERTAMQGSEEIVLESNRPGESALWRMHERKWALNCGTALAVWWFALVLVVVAGLMSIGK